MSWRGWTGGRGDGVEPCHHVASVISEGARADSKKRSSPLLLINGPTPLVATRSTLSVMDRQTGTEAAPITH